MEPFYRNLLLFQLLFSRKKWIGLTTMNLPGNTNRKNDYRQQWIQVLWGLKLTQFFGASCKKNNIKLGTKVSISKGPLPGPWKVHASEMPWSLSFISFTVNLPLTTDITTVVKRCLWTWRIRKLDKKEGKGGQGYGSVPLWMNSKSMKNTSLKYNGS
jgi:hypothetical protein